MDNELMEQVATATARLGDIAEALERERAAKARTRAPSKAHLIGSGSGSSASGTEPGAFLRAITGMRDPGTYPEAKATLDEIGSSWQEPWGKATLGTTDATGGWIMPNAMVDAIVKPGRYRPGVLDLVTMRPGVSAATVDIPFRGAAPAAATVIGWGQPKENVDLAYNGYTVTMYTLARIHDLAKQFVRHSAGAAEADVTSELQDAMRRGVSTYLISGTGSSEPYGLRTALTNAPGTFTSTFSSPSNTTVAGSIAAAISVAAGDLAARDVYPNGAVLNSGTYWQMLRQGADAAGFFFNPASGPNAIEGVRPGTLISPFGIPVVPDSLIHESDLIVGAFDSLKVYQGDAFRIDTSDQAGERWDKNLVGFRGEQEIGIDARPAVYAGNFQLVDDVTP